VEEGTTSSTTDEEEDVPASTTDLQVASSELAEDPDSRTAWSDADIAGSEWKIAIQWFDDDGLPKRGGELQETWLRFKEDYVVEWGIGATGVWSLDGQFLSISRDFALGWGGKRILSCKLAQKQNEAYIEGMVRGWTPLTAASVMGQWQALRLGIDRTPYGEPFWNTRPTGTWTNSDGETVDGATVAAQEEEEPEPFWTGLQGAMVDIKNTIVNDKGGDGA